MAIFGAKKKQTEQGTFLLSKDSPFLMQEAYKALRTNVQFSLPGNECKCIAVTSGERADGKSTTAINLALAFGQLDKRVLLIDGDLRMPTVARKMNLKNGPGLSDLLVGEATVEKAVQQSKKYNISVLSAGKLPPDPTWLLESKQMKDLLESFRGEYDYIFIDLPPVLTVTDAAILSHAVDGFLLVVQNDHTEHKVVTAMLDQLQLANAKILGFVYTQADLTGGNRYSSRYKYKYKYGYSYGYGSRGGVEPK
ncbi:MAG: CpsD/CapB family tyrosine-protein kinase [Clostridiales bacterium]|nr:CpsD/CapB family tyrosine-protein kinase [Clostridiales bacterium]